MTGEIVAFLQEQNITEDPATLEALLPVSQVIALDRGERLAVRSEEMYYVLLDGALRSWLLDREGNEITDDLIFRRGQAFTDYSALRETESMVTIEALGPTRVLAFPQNLTREYCLKDPALATSYIDAIREMYLRIWEHRNAIITLDARGRYLWFLERFPGLIDRIYHKHIASFLGMTPVSLSRIRGQIRRGK